MQFLGTHKVGALPALHALLRTLLGKKKPHGGKHVNLGTIELPSAETMTAIEKLIYKHRAWYVPKTTITSANVCLGGFSERSRLSRRNLPPTQAALQQPIMKANYQAMIQNNDIVPQPQLPSPDNFGWELVDNKWLNSAPPAHLQLPRL